jgi:hypothetical protein
VARPTTVSARTGSGTEAGLPAGDPGHPYGIMTPMRGWRIGLVVVALAVVAVGVGVGVVVGSDDDPAEGEPAADAQADDATGPVIPSAVGAPGTSLGDGFSVAEGTVLIGDPIPNGLVGLQDGVEIVDEGWTATLLVDGAEPRALVDAYLAQAEAAGLVPMSSGCGLDVEALVCGGGARSADRAEARSLLVRTVRGPRNDLVSDHVEVRYSTIDRGWRHSGDIPFADDGPPDLEPVTAWPPLPAVGEPISSDGEVRTPIPVQEGSRLAGPVHLSLDDATGGIVALLEVTGDPDEVFRSYLDVVGEAEGFQPSTTDERTIGDAAVTEVSTFQAGGDHLELTLVERPGRPVWLAIRGSHD